jgi:hypothetical protein
VGNAACDEEQLQAFVDEVLAHPESRWVGVGDTCEFINRSDKRFDPEALPEWLRSHADLAKYQRDHFIDAVLPIKDQCLALVEGNHEETMRIRSERDVYATICEKMGATEDNPLALGMSGFLRLIFQRHINDCRMPAWTVDCFLTHGWWNGRLHGNGELNLERIHGWHTGQLTIAGHDHKPSGFALTRYIPLKNGQMVERIDHCVGAGTFLGLATYAQAKGYRPSPRTWSTLLVEPDKQSIRLLQ